MRDQLTTLDTHLDALTDLLVDHGLADEDATQSTLDGLGCAIRLYGDQIPHLHHLLKLGLMAASIEAHPANPTPHPAP